jgi:MotA/TolQ/ExbB proton channel family
MASNVLKKKFYMWWLSVMLIATSFFWASMMGVVTKVWETDITMLTSLIAVIFVASNVLLGYVAYNYDKNHLKPKLANAVNTIWFISEILMALGMLGTVIGLIAMLGANVVGNSLQDMNSIQTLLGNMWLHMGLALYTNAVGIICSIILKVQVHFIAGDVSDEA